MSQFQKTVLILSVFPTKKAEKSLSIANDDEQYTFNLLFRPFEKCGETLYSGVF